MLRVLGSAVIVFASPVSVAADLVDVANIVRTRHCGEASLPDKPLVASAHLDSAAAAVADGAEVTEAIAAAGYRAKASASLRVSTSKGKDDVVARELSRHFCHLVADPEFIDIGVHLIDLVMYLTGYKQATRVSGHCTSTFGLPIDLTRVLKIDQPMVRARYELDVSDNRFRETILAKIGAAVTA